MKTNISVECSDVVNFSCDVLVLKYAQQFYGADARVAGLLGDTNISPTPGKYALIRSEGSIEADYVLFLGTLKLYQFGYGQIHDFAYSAMQTLSQQMPNAKHVAMTVHGVGYGLDEQESFLAQLAGLSDAFRDGVFPDAFERLTIVERSQGRAKRLQNIVAEYLPREAHSKNNASSGELSLHTRIDAGAQSETKPHVFTAMPFSASMEDVYNFGILDPVKKAGYLCERVDMDLFTGDILGRIKSRIETASIVIADLTGANANVYLEVGYAWGKGLTTFLLCHEDSELKFDVKGQRCIIYKSISDLAKKLTADLSAIEIQS